MERSLQFKYQDNQELARRRTIKYFTEQGFKPSESANEVLIFKRGNTFLNMVTFNPLQWKSTITITFSNSEIKAFFDIDTSFQTVTSKEEQLWEAFIHNFQESIQEEKDFSGINKKLVGETKRSSFKYILMAFLGGIIGAAAGCILAYFTDYPDLITICAVIGATTLISYKIEKERKADKVI